MTLADRFAVAAGISGAMLMDNAGRAVAREIEKRWTVRPVTVLCGPGNNGGDGFVVAIALREAGWPVTVALSCPASALRGEAAAFAESWGPDIQSLSPDCLDGAELVVDAVFGAGLSRDVDGLIAEVLGAAQDASLPLVAVDIPSGVDGATGAVRGFAAAAALTVSFFRMKPGHVLLPGRDLCGSVTIADIGIPDDVCYEIAAQTWVNRPSLWQIPVPHSLSHKYTRGHVLVVGGTMTGAARLATRAARRVGAGLVSIVCSPHAFTAYAVDAPGALVFASHTDTDEAVFREVLADERRNVVLIGPGHGELPRLRQRILEVLATGRGCVLDADAIAAFAETPDVLFQAIQGPVILTPHAGEFSRLFPDLTGGRLHAVRMAAKRSGAVVVLKGSDTVIAAPDGKAVVNDNAPPTLSTAGSGDVLAGLIAGLLAQGMRPLAAAAAAVWVHGDAAKRLGPGLIAEDLPEMVPMVLRALTGEADTN
ncbi:MAG: NAD(P)H-hydrate dehydratase [Rhodospirillaceae bacterium]|nr:NAD(P)H-hydrate dehydratase [Rhodospirillaceae bacterium]